MRLYTDTLTYADLFDAAKTAKVHLDAMPHASRKRARAFEVHLTDASGKATRRPNNRGNGDRDAYAATWDAWGVFLSVLYCKDDNMVCGTAYANAGDFDYRTDYRFALPVWPEDTHANHVWRFAGVPRERACAKCSAVQRWPL